MKKKRLLMIADADGFWTMRLLKYLVLPQGYEVVLFPIWGDGEKYSDFYRENNVTVYHDPHTLPIVRHIPRVRMWARIALNARDLAKLGPFDVVHNNYLSQRDLALGQRMAQKFGARWVASFWGSDLMRSSASALRLMKPYLEKADVISVHNQLNVDMIRKTYGDAIAQKTCLLYFGQTGYADIDAARAQYTPAACRARFGIAPDRFTVAVGCSASSAQQQLEVVETLAALPRERLEKMTLILQQTYGENDAAYVARTRETAARLPCQTVSLTRFMGPEESAMLRLSADVFVLAIKTDAFSASMQEYLYAGACVIKGDWLQYPQLSDMGLPPLPEFCDFAEIPGLLTLAMDGKLKGYAQAQRALFPKLYSWEAVRTDWLKLYNEA